MTVGAGRYAPSPSGDLHIGNLRTAVLAWLFARSSSRTFLLRVEDLDRERSTDAARLRQIADLQAIGLTWHGTVMRQSDRHAAYIAALDLLTAEGHTYECYCTRREIREAARAPHSVAGDAAYPGTCALLTETERAVRRRAAGRPPTIRLRGDGARYGVHDLLHPGYEGPVHDVVLRRFDGAIAYNLAVVVDDIHQGIDQIVRGDDLLAGTPTQLHLTALLGGRPVEYAHVPLVLDAGGRRLAKRNSAITLGDLAAAGVPVDRVRRSILQSLGAAISDDAASLEQLANSFRPALLPKVPWTFDPNRIASPR
ncbi:glutamyl-tRNA synthetase [Antricoccus suffuscus]|uniref:Glutamyl-tRNA synthetase n=1 Tax=Antricoccus suffuscus TaxID=1629062 RepID=A0A2T0Z034_9ACTN|nr:tRNA glutamyl-Q(34) synthetase GluQRS [Antricoccus suffuscus]PRZ29701.1 glutamyl-tRNA synthetase [Antricoccus suffuscus]